MTRISARLTTFLAATALFTGVVASGCSTGTKSSPDVGKVAFALSAGGLTLSQVNYTVNQGATQVTTGAINVTDPNSTVSLDLVLPVGTGYTIALSATAQPGSVACTSGTSPAFSIIANQTNPVSIVLTCGTAGSATGPTGNATINASVSVVNGDNCPNIGFVSASPAQTSVGAPVALNALATDSDASDASTLTYTWSSGGTTFATGAVATFTCAPSGTQTVTLTVDDHHVPSNCPVTATVKVNCIATGVGGSTGTGGAATGGVTGTGGAVSEAACGSCELASSDGNCDPGFLSQDGSGVPFGCDSLPTSGQVTACKALLTCINTNNCSTNGNGTAAGDNAVEGCYCGPSPETSSACNGGTGIVGLCKTQFHNAAVADGAAGDPRAAGLTTASAEGAFASFISVASFDPTTAVGMADNIKDCAVHSACTVCNSL